MSESQIETFKQYRSVAMERLQHKEHRYRPTVEDVARLAEISSRHYADPAILVQMDRDLRIYLLYDAISMWLDPVGGLAPHAPELFDEIGRAYFGDEVSGVE